MTKPTSHTKNVPLACFHVSSLHAKKLKQFSDSKFVKEYIDILVENICPEKSSQFVNISLSRRTVVRRIHEMS